MSNNLVKENKALRKSLEDIALLDEADGHELKISDAFKAVAIATNALGEHPSSIFSRRLALAQEKPNG